ncbi:MAG TPA: hypothetical protein VF928_09445 [Usitatibacteraceae bacterium]
MKQNNLYAAPAARPEPTLVDVSRRSRMTIAVFVAASLAAGLVYAGKQFASHEIVVTYANNKHAAFTAPEAAAAAAIVRPDPDTPAKSMGGKEPEGNVVDMTY